MKLWRFAYTFKIQSIANMPAKKSLKYHVIYCQHYLLSQAKFVFMVYKLNYLLTYHFKVAQIALRIAVVDFCSNFVTQNKLLT